MTRPWLPPTRHNGYLSDTGFGYFEDPVLDQTLRGPDNYAPIRGKWLSIMSKYGSDRYMQDYDELVEEETEGAEFDPNAQYTNAQLQAWADKMLREDSRRELCRKCGNYGEETENVEAKPQFHKNGDPILDDEGQQLYVEFPELECDRGHRWYAGEGKARGIGGKDPILFKNHLDERKRREIYTAQGTPDPNIVSGMYNRSHPQGRKINSSEQRKKNGASWYR